MPKNYKKSQTPKSKPKKPKATKRTRRVRDNSESEEDIPTHLGGAAAQEPNSDREQDLPQSRASSPTAGQQDTFNSARSRASSASSRQPNDQDDFSDESDQERPEPDINANELETSVVASDYKEHGQLNPPSPAAIKNTAQSSPATLKNKAEGKIQIAEAASQSSGSDGESEPSTGSPTALPPAMQAASDGADGNVEVILIDDDNPENPPGSSRGPSKSQNVTVSQRVSPQRTADKTATSQSSAVHSKQSPNATHHRRRK